MVAAFILSVVLCWNEYFFAALLTSTNAKTLPVMVASQTGSQGINWWSMAALSTAAIAPLVIIGIFLERYIVKGLTAGAVKISVSGKQSARLNKTASRPRARRYSPGADPVCHLNSDNGLCAVSDALGDSLQRSLPVRQRGLGKAHAAAEQIARRRPPCAAKAPRDRRASRDDAGWQRPNETGPSPDCT